jgi:ketosteroid isomerase-like protein
MAYAAGKYSASFTDPKGHPVKDEGKYLNVLRRVDGKWRVVADAFSSNKEPPR